MKKQSVNNMRQKLFRNVQVMLLTTVSLFSSISLSAMLFNNEEGAVKSYHSLSVTVLGVEYGYEQALADYWSVLGRVGMNSYSFDYRSSFTGFTVKTNVDAVVTLEPRYYTSMGRRVRLGRTTHNNSSDYISVRAQYLIGENKFTITPLYGIRRSETRHWFHEFAFGPRWTIGQGISPSFIYRLGYLF